MSASTDCTFVYKEKISDAFVQVYFGIFERIIWGLTKCMHSIRAVIKILIIILTSEYIVRVLSFFFVQVHAVYANQPIGVLKMFIHFDFM